MDEKCLAEGPENSPLPPAAPLSERRQRARDMLSSQQSHLERLEQELAGQLERLAEDVAESVRRSEAASSQSESEAVAAVQAQFDTLRERFSALDGDAKQLRQQLEDAQTERGRLEQELRVRETLLKEAQGHEEQRRVELADARERLADVEAQLTAARARHAEFEQQLEAEREQLADKERDTKDQRRRIAREFKQQRAEHLAELDERRAELEAMSASQHTHLEEHLSRVQAELAECNRELEELRAAEGSAGESAQARETIAALEREIEELRSRPAEGGSEADAEELRQLREERDDLRDRLETAEAQLAAGGGGDSEASSDMQRRFEMAVEEVRELKRANSELEQKLKARGSAPAAAPGGGLDWEAQKQRLLASLEADDYDENDEDEVAERTSIEGTIRITDEVVASKDREIAELKRQLEEGAVAGSGAAAAQTAELINADETIRQEREKLLQMQAEWREKIGKAEIDISVERAKIARERNLLEEKARQLQLDQDSRPQGDAPSGGAEGKPARGRWLARLGLKDMDDSK